jgi:kinesin family protein 3/17
MADERVKVVVRKRPLSAEEREAGESNTVSMDQSASDLLLWNPKAEGKEQPRRFTYDQVFDSDSQQYSVFDSITRPILDSCIEGYNGELLPAFLTVPCLAMLLPSSFRTSPTSASSFLFATTLAFVARWPVIDCVPTAFAGTIFAYGQTGTGKTFTMEGKNNPPELKGIIPTIFKYIFRHIGTSSKAYVITASFLEIYNEEIRDLLSKNQRQELELREDPDRGPYVKGLLHREIKSVDDFSEVLATGTKNRSVRATLMNQDSSRSHSIFSIRIEVSDPGSNDCNGSLTAGKLNLVDLAGSERQSKSRSTGDRLKEATKINLSLSALGNVISSLSDGKAQHIPYRDSKLTRLLQDSLGGNCKTVMIANIGPAASNYDETLSTLRYASRAKAIKNKPKRNEDPKDAKLREFQEEIERLKKQISGSSTAAAGGGDESMQSESAAGKKQKRIEQIKQKMREEMKHELASGSGAQPDKAEKHARQAMEAYKNEAGMSLEERDEIQKEMDNLGQERQEIERKLKKEEQEEEQLKQQLQQVEARVIYGNENLLEKEQRQQAELDKQRKEMEKRKEEEERERQCIQELEEQQLMREEKYKTLEDEVQGKRKKVDKLKQRLRSKQQQLDNLKGEQAKERQQLQEQTGGLASKVQLKALILHHFVPETMLEELISLSQYDDVQGRWTIPHRSAAGRIVQEKQQASKQQQQQQRRPATGKKTHRSRR